MKAILIFIFCFKAALGQKYNLTDLEILKEEKNYSEFFMHALDILPRERKSKWKDMVSTMAEELVDLQLSKPQNNQKLLINKVSSWPSLRSSEYFHLKRARIIEMDLKNCKSDACTQRLYSNWLMGPYYGKSALALLPYFDKSKAITGEQKWKLVQGIVKDKFGDLYCKKPIIASVIQEKLELLESSFPKSLKELKLQISEKLHTNCWNAVSKILKSKLYPRTSEKFDSLYRVLKAKGSLSEDDEAFYSMINILNNPAKGPTFNLSWSRLVNLGKNAGQRQSILNKLKTLDPLPGETFSSMDLGKRSILLKAINRHFPEYIDHYARTCVKFLKGEGSFPNGNPTLHCKDLFKTSKGTRYIPYSLFKQFEKAKL